MSERGRPPRGGGTGAGDEAGELEAGRMLPPLDGAPGPARRLSSARSAAMVSAIVEAARSPERASPAAAAPAGSAPGSAADSSVSASAVSAPITGQVPEPAPPPPPPGAPLQVRRSAMVGPRAGRPSRRVTAAIKAVVIAASAGAAAGGWVALRGPAEEPRRGPDEVSSGRGSRSRSGAKPGDIEDSAPLPAPRRGSGEPDAGPGAGERVAGERGPGERGAGERGPGERGPGERGPGERGPGERGPGERGPGERGPGERGPGDDSRLRREHGPSRRQRRSLPIAPSPGRAAPGSTAPSTTAAASTAPAEPELSARLPPDAPVEDIMSIANQRRKERRWREAESLYERVMRDHAGTDAAAIATVASAALHHEHLRDPAGALRRFHQALRLRPDGPLAEEARWGLAETHRTLRDAAAERDALRAFLAAHPRSVSAPRARRRLAELGSVP